MKKIPSLFQREEAARGKASQIVDKITPGCEWVLSPGKWQASRKWDGTAALVKDGLLYARYDAKQGKAPPEGAIPCQEPDPITGHWPHWVLANRPEDRWIREAASAFFDFPKVTTPLPNGTYEAVGPKINGNPEGLPDHVLPRHGYLTLPIHAVSFTGLRDFLFDNPMEGIVFTHRDGRMCKVKRKDYGMSWPAKP